MRISSMPENMLRCAVGVGEKIQQHAATFREASEQGSACRFTVFKPFSEIIRGGGRLQKTISSSILLWSSFKTLQEPQCHVLCDVKPPEPK